MECFDPNSKLNATQLGYADMLIEAVRKWMPNKVLLSQVKGFERIINFEQSKDLAEDDGNQKQVIVGKLSGTIIYIYKT